MKIQERKTAYDFASKWGGSLTAKDTDADHLRFVELSATSAQSKIVLINAE